MMMAPLRNMDPDDHPMAKTGYPHGIATVTVISSADCSIFSFGSSWSPNSHRVLHPSQFPVGLRSFGWVNSIIGPWNSKLIFYQNKELPESVEERTKMNMIATFITVLYHDYSALCGL